MTRKNISDAVGNISNRHIQEAADFQIPKKNMGKQFAMRKAVAVAAAIVVVFSVSVPALAAADVAAVYDLLYTVAPSIAQKLKPVNMSSEDKGIQLEVISAYVEGSEAKIFVSVQDLEGNRIDETTDLFDSYSINTPFDCICSCANISYDAETKTATFLISISQWKEQDIVGEKITFSARKMLSGKQEYDVPLHGLNMSEISTAPETITPAHIFGSSGIDDGEPKDNFRGLKTTGILDSPVDGVNITAMGYVDEKLHIQVKYENVLETDNHGEIYFQNEQGERISYSSNVVFSMDHENQERYEEYIYHLSEDDLTEYEAYGYFVTSSVLITGDWSVTFPLELVSQ